MVQQFNNQRAMIAKNYFIINLPQLHNFIHQIQQLNISQNSIHLTTQKLNLQGKVLEMDEIQKLALSIQSRSKAKQQAISNKVKNKNWAFREQKLFCSILPYYFILNNLSIFGLTFHHFGGLQKIFINKTSINMYFQWKHLDSLANNFKTQWRDIDLNHLKLIMMSDHNNSSGITKWKNISFKLFQMAQFQYFYSPRQCRQMWMNHLNPDILKTSWQPNQDLQILKLIKKYGCKWSLISKIMQGIRTEHMIKNRVKYYVRKHKIRSKILKQQQIDSIIHHLSQKITSKSIQSQNHPTHSRYNQSTTTINQEQQNQQHQQDINIFNVINFIKPTHQPLITQNEIDEIWQYTEQQYTIQNNQFLNIY